MCGLVTPFYIERNACLMDVPEGLRYKQAWHTFYRRMVFVADMSKINGLLKPGFYIL